MQDEGNKDQPSQPPAGWVFTPGGVSTPVVPNAPIAATATQPPTAKPSAHQLGDSLVAWSASEYVGNPKTVAWFAMLAAASVSISVIVYFLTGDIISIIVIVVLAIIVGVFAARQPQVLDYSLDEGGIHMGPRFYPYSSFKTFSVVEDGAFSHISLLPLKRFIPPLAVHYSPADEDKIATTLADYLPYEEQKRDVIESFSRRVRF